MHGIEAALLCIEFETGEQVKELIQSGVCHHSRASKDTEARYFNLYLLVAADVDPIHCCCYDVTMMVLLAAIVEHRFSIVTRLFAL